MVTVDGTLYGSKNSKIEVYIHKVKGVEDKNRKALIYFCDGSFVM